jgi:glycosyltransferase involved in cell wall biosynthesis
VRFVPFLPPERFGALLASSDAFVLPSEGEGFPLALQEALLAGLACVVVRHPGYDRYVGTNDVLYVERDAAAIREALARLAGDPALRAELGARARAAGERSFGVAAFADAYAALYRELVARPTRARPRRRAAPASGGAARGPA